MYMPLSLKILTQGIRGDGVLLNLVFKRRKFNDNNNNNNNSYDDDNGCSGCAYGDKWI